MIVKEQYDIITNLYKTRFFKIIASGSIVFVTLKTVYDIATRIQNLIQVSSISYQYHL